MFAIIESGYFSGLFIFRRVSGVCLSKKGVRQHYKAYYTIGGWVLWPLFYLYYTSDSWGM